jgi:hypothetical protein
VAPSSVKIGSFSETFSQCFFNEIIIQQVVRLVLVFFVRDCIFFTRFFDKLRQPSLRQLTQTTNRENLMASNLTILIPPARASLYDVYAIEVMSLLHQLLSVY